MSYKFLTISLLVVSVVWSPANAQTVAPGAPNPIPKSPNVEALDKYGDYGVSLFSGVPDITIPIYTIKSGDLTIPITLNYHASGIKPTDVASWVGLGWSLNTGGVVSRSIRGKADESSYLSQAFTASPDPCTDFSYLDRITSYEDADPDVYSYSIPGRRGKFFRLYGSSSPLLVPYAPVKITWPGSSEYNLVDEKGVKYRFGTGSLGTASEGTTYFDTNSGSTVTGTTAWHLMDMLAPNSNDKIQWTYQSLGGPIITSDVSHYISVSEYCDSRNGGGCPTHIPTYQSSNPYGSTTPYGVQYIYFEGGSIEFVLATSNRTDGPATASKALDHIDVKDVNGSVIRTIKFNTGNFKNSANQDHALKLNSVEFKDANSSVVQKYTLSYFSDDFPWSSTSYTNARDFWGYYNGATGNTNLIPYQKISSSGSVSAAPSDYWIGGATDRNVNTSFIKKGVLKRIDFPTGGYTIFDFESNKYLDTTEKLAGGLRVTRIESYDCSTCNPIVKAYKYGLNEDGYGTPQWYSSELNYVVETKVVSQTCGGVNPWTSYTSRVFHSNTAFTLNSFDESPMSYKYVREIIGDPGSTLPASRSTPGAKNASISGFTDYIFDDAITYSDFHLPIGGSGKEWINGQFWQRGRVTKKTVYDNSNYKVSETSTSWTKYNSSTTTVGVGIWKYLTASNSVNCIGGSGCPGYPDRSSITYRQPTNFVQESGVYLPTSITEKTYEKGTAKFTSKTTLTTYNSEILQPTRIETNRVGSETAVTMNLYPMELFATSSSGNVEGIYMLNTKNILVTPIESWTFIKNGANYQYTGGTLTTFKKNPNNSDQVVPDKIYSFEANPQGTTTTKAATTINNGTGVVTMDPNYKARVDITSFDVDGNLLQASKTNDLKNSYLYGYGNSLPVAEAKNAQNILTITPTTSETTVSVFRSPGPSNGTGSATYTFTTQREGTVDIKIDYTNGDTGGYVEIINSTAGIFNTTNTFLTKNGTCLSTTFKSVSNVPPGTYTLTVNVTSGGTNGWTICGKIYYPTTSIGGTKEIYYEGFEEHPSATTDVNACHTGRKYYAGDFSVVFTPPNGDTYIIEYWYLNSGVWTYITKAYTGNTTLTEGTAIDDVRIYPARAQMKSYTYNTINGMTSSIDENGTTLIYEYDSFGRLYRVKNDKGGIEKQYTYNYNNGN